ncbi:hypothetical protein [Mesorhizobium sp. NPDC059025]|uniref:hypothetical protein n=1 Tax=unclassified Mesorhizobium TaxID=325217 RepID=UPI0036A00275
MSKTYDQYLSAISHTTNFALEAGLLQQCKIHGDDYEGELATPEEIEERFGIALRERGIDLDSLFRVLKDAPTSCPRCKV